MGICMKTTIDIADSLLREAKHISMLESTTVRELVQEGLREVIKKHKAGRPFKLHKATFKGKGLQSDFIDAPWDKIRSAVYEDHGG